MGCLSSYGTATVTASTKLTQNAYRATSGTWQRIYTDYTSEYQQISGKHVFKVAPSGNADSAIIWKTALTIDNGGDISFYEDTGSTAKLLWDASAETLIIGDNNSWSSAHSLVVGTGGNVGGSQGALFIGKYDGTIASGNEVGRIDFGSSWDETLGATISAEADSAWTHSTSHPTRLLLKTTSASATTPTTRMTIDSSGHITPGADNEQDFGSTSKRWASIYTGDLHLSNENSKANDVDGTTGNWTIQEGENDLYIINNKSGKKFKFSLEEVS
jgi:hypothetical protein